MNFHDSVISFFQNIKIKWCKDLDAFEDLSSDFPGLTNLYNLVDLRNLCNLTSLKSLYITLCLLKRYLYHDLIITGTKLFNSGHFLWNGSWKTQLFTNIFCTLSDGGCWGRPMLLFWKLVDETQMWEMSIFAVPDSPPPLWGFGDVYLWTLKKLKWNKLLEMGLVWVERTHSTTNTEFCRFLSELALHQFQTH